MNVRLLILSGCALLASAPLTSAGAADWSDSVFPIKSHDFGTVAVASKTEFRFPINNTLNQTMHIQSVRTSCGCTTPIVETEYIAPGQSGTILAKFNTPTFRGKRGATMTVIIDQPFYSEVRLRVDGYIRSDLVFHPGAVEFGTMQQGEPHTRSTKLYYAGRSDWQVVNVRSNKPWLVPTFVQSSRGPGSAQYDVMVQVREDAPEGFFQDEVIIQTNDRNMPNVPLKVSGTVETALVISPQSIALGTVRPDQEITQRLVIRGREPFTIGSIECEGWDVQTTPTDVAKEVHMVTMTIKPTTATGAQRVPLVIKTAGEAPVTAKAILTAEIIGDQVASKE